MHFRSLRSPGAPASAAAAVLATFAVLAAPSLAEAQPGAPPPPPPGAGPYGGYRGGYYGPPPRYRDPTRRGLTIGFGFELGGMSSDSNLTNCIDCNYDPIAGGFDFHLGAMLTPQLAIMGEFVWQAQTIDSSGFNWLSQSMVLGAAQLWLLPQLWIKGGIGFANLQSHYDDGFAYSDNTIDTGVALLGAVGFEVLSTPWFALDLQGRLASGSYEGIDDHVNTAMVGLGLNWY